MYVKADFAYDAKRDIYVCPAGEELIYRYTREERSLQVRRYWISECQTCPVQGRCTNGTERRITHSGRRSRTAADQRFSSLRVFGRTSSPSPTRSGTSLQMS